MTAIVLPDIDRSTLEDLKQRMPSLRLADIELPSMERAGRQADQAIDRLLGRSHSSGWTWLAAALGLVAVVGTIAAALTWGRRPGSSAHVGTGLPGPSTHADTGIDVTAAYGETSITGAPDITIGEAEFAVDGGTTEFEERQP